MVQGTCLCGSVRYEVDEPFGSMANCHCSMCRKQHGAAFVTFAVVGMSAFRWTSGEDEVVTYQSSESGKRAFCRRCGSAVPGIMAEMGQVFCFPGSLQGELHLKPQCHMFAGSKASWYTITDALPQFEAYPPGIDAQPIARPRVEPKDGVVQGSCLCGDIAYELQGAPRTMRNCHCSRCRRALSAAHASNVFYPLDAFQWTRGQESLVDYALPETKYFGVSFCKRCGSKMPRVYQERKIVMVPAGSLDGDPGIRSLMHIYVGSKANWYDITDDLPQHLEGPPAT